MDNLQKSLNKVSLYDVKAYVRKAQNAVLNLSEMESKVREATNNEPWGTSTTLMAEIARGTFNYREREEICNLIFRRFTEKTTREWRQIYKALQLMEYLVKHGSERFVDDARANVKLVSLVTNLHYIDSNNVDQGVNVRHRARELVKLLNDEGKIREERKKAKETQKKFNSKITSSSSDSYHGSSNYGGRRLGSNMGRTTYDENDDEEAYSSRVFGDGGVYGQRFEEQRSTAGHKAFEEYDIEASHKPSNTSRPSVSTSQVHASSTTTQPVDLFSFDSQPAAPAASNAVDEDDDDEFDDFQSADASAPVASAAPVTQSNNLADLLTSSYSQAPIQQQQQQQQYIPFNQQPISTPSVQPAVTQAKKKDDVFGSLFATAKSQSHATPAKPATSSFTSNSTSNTNTLNDDLFGSFSSPAPQQSAPQQQQQQQKSSSNDIVDLLSF